MCLAMVLSMIKQLLLYKINDDMFQLPTDFHEIIEKNMAFKGCAPRDTEQDGFIFVQPTSLYSFEVRDTGLNVSVATFQRQKKVIPSTELKRRVKARLAQLKSKNVNLNKDSRDDVEYEMKRTMAETAFSTFTPYFVIFFHDLQIIGINASESLADEIVSFIRKRMSNSSFPVVPYGNKAIQSYLLSCIEDSEDAVVGSVAHMLNESDKSEISFKNKSNAELEEKAKTHRVTKLSLELADIHLTLSDSTPLSLSSMKTVCELEKVKKSMDHDQKLEIFDSNIRVELSAIQQVIYKLIKLDESVATDSEEVPTG